MKLHSISNFRTMNHIEQHEYLELNKCLLNISDDDLNIAKNVVEANCKMGKKKLLQDIYKKYKVNYDNVMKKHRTDFGKKHANYKNSKLKDEAVKLEILCNRPTDEETFALENLLGFNPHAKMCIYCNKNCSSKNTEEIIPITQFGRYNKMNCVSACGTCNSSKGAITGELLDKWLTEKSENSKQIIKYINDYKHYLVIDKNMIVLGKTVEQRRYELLNKVENDIKIYEEDHTIEMNLMIHSLKQIK